MSAKPIRVLVVDDAVVVRKLIADVLCSEPGMDVVGLAANGRIALEKIPQVQPDIVTLDVEMPEMNGIETLTELRRHYPRLPVIMFSTLTERGAAATLDALAAGANDYATKPTKVGSLVAAMDEIRNSLVPKIRALCGSVEERPAVRPLEARHRAARFRQGTRVDVIGVGVSTGGPNALAKLFAMLPADIPVPILIVQHMPPMFTRLLAERLSAQGAVPVAEAKDGERIRPGGAWLAPGDFHLEVCKNAGGIHTRLHQGPPVNSCRPAVDVLFQSVAEVYGEHTLGVILTGMGQDGLRGSEAIHAAGGAVIAQDEATSVVWGMPGSVVRAGIADRVLPIDEMAREIAHRARGAVPA